MPMPSARPSLVAAVALSALATLLLAGCESDRSMQFANPFAPAKPPPPPPKPALPPINMAGRWMLASPAGGLCGMNFGVKAGGTEGTIAPEGGCPGDFFTSRHWTFDKDALVILDHKRQPLARLAASDPPGRFQGRSVNGLDVTLSR